jgi:hypothetical protein
MFKKIGKGYFLALAMGLVGCAVDPSTIVIDDAGQIHHTQHFLSDRRGRNYFPLEIPATGEREFIFDPRAYTWAAYDEQGQRVITGSASGGRDYCPENDGTSCRTMVGTFRVYSKRDENCRSGSYPVETHGGAKMPYCMYFFNGFTIHAAYDIPFKNSSHGCVWVLPSAAKWLNEEFIRIGTRVTILPYEHELPDMNDASLVPH